MYLQPSVNSDDLFPGCGHKRPVWDEHDWCVRCRRCSFSNPCSVCKNWSNEKWNSAEEFWKRQAEREKKPQTTENLLDFNSEVEFNWTDDQEQSGLLPTPSVESKKRTLLSNPYSSEYKVTLLPDPNQMDQDSNWVNSPSADKPNISSSILPFPDDLSEQYNARDMHDNMQYDLTEQSYTYDLTEQSHTYDLQQEGFEMGREEANFSTTRRDIPESDPEAMKAMLLSTARILGPELCPIKSSTDANGMLNISFPPSPAWFTELANASSLASSHSASSSASFLSFDDLNFDPHMLAAFSGLQMRPLVLDEDISELGRANLVKLTSEELADWEAQLRHCLVIPSVQDFIVASILKALNDYPDSNETAFIRKVLGLIASNVGLHMQVTSRLVQNVVMARRDAHLVSAGLSETSRHALRSQSTNGTVLFGGHISRFVNQERMRMSGASGNSIHQR